ncbi:MAG: hypothetical protein ACRDTM_05165 [Micromonosporaceae bacterium]
MTTDTGEPSPSGERPVPPLEAAADQQVFSEPPATEQPPPAAPQGAPAVGRPEPVTDQPSLPAVEQAAYLGQPMSPAPPAAAFPAAEQQTPAFPAVEQSMPPAFPALGQPAPAFPGVEQVPPVVPSRPRRRLGRWILWAAAVLAVVLAMGGALLVVNPYGALSTSRQAAYEKVDQRKAFVARVKRAVDARAKALLAGDEKGWLAPLDSGNKKLVADQRRIFQTLREMEISRYAYHVGLSSGKNLTSAVLKISYCFGNDKCQLMPESEAVISVREDKRGLAITKYTPRGAVRPWEVSELEVEVGRRVIVAAQPKYAHKLGTYRKLADRAAVHADRFAPVDTAGKYVIVVGSSGDNADQWYEEGIGEVKRGLSYDLWTAGEAEIGAVDIVIRGDKLKGDELRFVLDWHLGNAAAATGMVENEYWWLVTGISIYMGEGREDPGLFVVADDLRTYLKTWDGHLDRFYPSGNQSDAWSTAAWATVYRLIDKYGEKRFAAFHNAVARERVDYEDAAEKHLGRSLDKVQTDVVNYLRSLT